MALASTGKPAPVAMEKVVFHVEPATEKADLVLNSGFDYSVKSRKPVPE